MLLSPGLCSLNRVRAPWPRLVLPESDACSLAGHVLLGPGLCSLARACAPWPGLVLPGPGLCSLAVCWDRPLAGIRGGGGKLGWAGTWEGSVFSCQPLRVLDGVHCNLSHTWVRGPAGISALWSAC